MTQHLRALAEFFRRTQVQFQHIVPGDPVSPMCICGTQAYTWAKHNMHLQRLKTNSVALVDEDATTL